MVDAMEDRLGVIISIIDGNDNQEAIVTLMCLHSLVELAKVVLGLVAKGVHSTTSRIRLFDYVALPIT